MPGAGHLGMGMGGQVGYTVENDASEFSPGQIIHLYPEVLCPIYVLNKFFLIDRAILPLRRVSINEPNM